MSNVELICSFEVLSKNRTQRRLLAHTHTYKTQRGLGGRKAWISPWVWFVLHLVAAQLFQTIRLESASTDHPTRCWPCASRQPLQRAHTCTHAHARTHAEYNPDSWPPLSFVRIKVFGPSSVFPVALKGFCHCCLWLCRITVTVWTSLPSSAHIIFSVLQQKVFELGDVRDLPR